MSINDELRILVVKFNQAADKTLKLNINEKIKALIKGRPKDYLLDFTNMEINGLDFSHLNLELADFTGSTIADVNFAHTTLTQAKFSCPSRSKRKKIKADFSDAVCIGTDFSYSDLRQSRFNKTVVDDAKFDNAWLDRQVLSDLLPSAIVTPGIKPKISLDRISLEDADLQSMTIANTYLRYAYYKGTNLENTKFINTDVYGSHFQKAKNFNLVSLDRAINRDRINVSEKIERKYKKLQSEIKNMPKIHAFFKPEIKVKNVGEIKPPARKKARIH